MINELYLFKACRAMGIAANTIVEHVQELVADVQHIFYLKMNMSKKCCWRHAR
jgi:hypothetical protein